MIQPSDIPDIFTKRDLFLQKVKERIWAHPCDFNDTWRNLKSSVNKNDRRLAAGVLMPLIFRKSPSDSSGTEGSFAILLVKRSSRVTQAGDLSFPGGMLNPVGDRTTGMLQRFEAMTMHALLLERADHPLDHAALLGAVRGDGNPPVFRGRQK